VIVTEVVPVVEKWDVVRERASPLPFLLTASLVRGDDDADPLSCPCRAASPLARGSRPHFRVDRYQRGCRLLT
jgi:hypothetical protein